MQPETPRAPGEATISDAELIIVCAEKADAQHVRANFPFEEFCETSVVVGKEASLRGAKPNASIIILGANEETAKAFATRIGRPVHHLKEAVRLMNSTRLAAAVEEGGKEVQPEPAEQIKPAKPTKTAKAEATPDPGDRAIIWPVVSYLVMPEEPNFSLIGMERTYASYMYGKHG